MCQRIITRKSGTLAVMANEEPRRRPRGRPPNPAGRKYPKDDSRYTPTKADLEEDMRVDATFEELVDIMFGRRRRPATDHARRVVH